MWNVCLLELEVTLPRPFMKGKENKEQGDQTSGCRRSYLVRSSEDLLLNLLGAMNARYFSFNSHEWQFHKGRQFQSVRSQSSRAEHQLDWAGICFQNLGRKWRCRNNENRDRQHRTITAMLFPDAQRNCVSPAWSRSSIKVQAGQHCEEQPKGL